MIHYVISIFATTKNKKSGKHLSGKGQNGQNNVNAECEYCIASRGKDCTRLVIHQKRTHEHARTHTHTHTYTQTHTHTHARAHTDIHTHTPTHTLTHTHTHTHTHESRDHKKYIEISRLSDDLYKAFVTI